MSVTRYDCEVWNHPVRGEDVRSVPSPDGRWVEYKDYEKLLDVLREIVECKTGLSSYRLAGDALRGASND